MCACCVPRAGCARPAAKTAVLLLLLLLLLLLVVPQFLMPTMNPDGFARRQRYNAAGADLNRNFPSVFSVCAGQAPETCNPALLQHATGYTPQPETLAIMAWTLATPFTASANLHEGAIVVSCAHAHARTHAHAQAASPHRDCVRWRLRQHAALRAACRLPVQANYPWDGYNDGSYANKGSPNLTPGEAARCALTAAGNAVCHISLRTRVPTACVCACGRARHRVC
jgi:hypothetical protein